MITCFRVFPSANYQIDVIACENESIVEVLIAKAASSICTLYYLYLDKNTDMPWDHCAICKINQRLQSDEALVFPILCLSTCCIRTVLSFLNFGPPKNADIPSSMQAL